MISPMIKVIQELTANKNRTIRKRIELKLLVTTGFGNIIQGGVDIWVNHFIDLVLPKLKDEYIIFVDGKRSNRI